jgi:hypothetical protein
MDQIIAWFLANGKLFLDIIFYAIAIASIIVKWTKTPKDDTFLAWLINILKKLSLYKEQ